MRKNICFILIVLVVLMCGCKNNASKEVHVEAIQEFFRYRYFFSMVDEKYISYIGTDKENKCEEYYIHVYPNNGEYIRVHDESGISEEFEMTLFIKEEDNCYSIYDEEGMHLYSYRP